MTTESNDKAGAITTETAHHQTRRLALDLVENIRKLRESAIRLDAQERFQYAVLLSSTYLLQRVATDIERMLKIDASKDE